MLPLADLRRAELVGVTAFSLTFLRPSPRQAPCLGTGLRGPGRPGLAGDSRSH